MNTKDEKKLIDIICIHQFCKHAQKMDCISNTQFCLKYVIPIAKKANGSWKDQ